MEGLIYIWVLRPQYREREEFFFLEAREENIKEQGKGQINNLR